MDTRQLELQMGQDQLPGGSDRIVQVDLNLIPGMTPGGDSTSQRTISYLEFNDGRVCWYYPVFPEVSGTHSQANPQYQEDTENYFYDDSTPISNAAHGYGDYPRVQEDEYYLEVEDWYSASNQQRQEEEQAQQQVQNGENNINTYGETVTFPAQPGSSSSMERNFPLY